MRVCRPSLQAHVTLPTNSFSYFLGLFVISMIGGIYWYIAMSLWPVSISTVHLNHVVLCYRIHFIYLQNFLWQYIEDDSFYNSCYVYKPTDVHINLHLSIFKLYLSWFLLTYHFINHPTCRQIKTPNWLGSSKHSRMLRKFGLGLTS